MISRSSSDEGPSDGLAELSDAERRIISVLRGATPEVGDFSISVRRKDGRYMVISSLTGQPCFGGGDSFDEAWEKAGI